MYMQTEEDETCQHKATTALLKPQLLRLQALSEGLEQAYHFLLCSPKTAAHEFQSAREICTIKSCHLT
jgi:hypothetical protein